MKNFRVVRISTLNGDATIYRDFLSEKRAWDTCHELEQIEIRKTFREFWYAATNVDDFRLMARTFYNYRKQFVIVP